MRLTPLTALVAAAFVVLTAWPADAQTRRARGVEREAYPGARTASAQRRARTTRRARPAPRARTRITVRRARSYLDPGTEVLPMSQPYTDYALPPLWYPTRIWDTTGSTRGPLPDNNFNLPGWYTP